MVLTGARPRLAPAIVVPALTIALLLITGIPYAEYVAELYKNIKNEQLFL